VITALRKAGNRILSIVGAKNKNLLVLEDEIKSQSDLFYSATDDGSNGRKGFTTDVLKELLEKEKIDLVYAIGPAVMMKAVSKITEEKKIKTLVSLNPIMLDGTGMCGACRVTVGGQTKFACADGPEFDAHKVNWDELILRLSCFKEQEKISLEKYRAECGCRK